MNRRGRIPFVLGAAGLLLALGALATGLVGAPAPGSASATNCGLQLGGTVAFCDTFDAPAGTGNRAGDLNGQVWGVSRATGNENIGGLYNAWTSAQLDLCGTTVAAPAPSDVRICNGQLRDAMNDGGTVAVVAMYPKQPFDFAGRTGTIAFDVTDDSNGTHQAWPELWVTDKPVPAPFAHFGEWNSPQNGFGIRFGGSFAPGTGDALCPIANTHRIGVDSAIVVTNLISADSAWTGGPITVTEKGCVLASSGPNGGMNHVEVRPSATGIDIWMSDAGSTTLKLVSTITAPIPLSRGLVWLEDVHYNAGKDGGTQRIHTFAWDNLAFDGPFTYHDLSYDVLDGTNVNADGTVNLGYRATSPSDRVNVSTLPMAAADIAAAADQRLMFNFYEYNAPLTLSYTINGHAYSAPWPDSNNNGFTSRSISIPLNKADLVAGAQSVSIWADQAIIVSNINIVLVNVPSGGVPTSTPTSTATATSTSTSTPTPTPTASPTATATPTVAATSTPTATPTPTPICRQVWQRSTDGGTTWGNWYLDAACPAGGHS